MTRYGQRQIIETDAERAAPRPACERPAARGAVHGGPGVLSRSIVDDADELKAAYRAFGIEPLQVGRPQRPSRTTTVVRERFAVAMSEQGFPTMTVAQIPDDRICVAYVRDTPPGSRWCEHDLEPGSVVVWNPSAHHHATNQPGLDIIAAQIDVDLVEALGHRVDLQVPPLVPGEVRILRPGADGTAAVARAMSNYRAVASTGQLPGPVYDEDLVLAATRLLTSDDRHRDSPSRRIDNRVVVQECLDYARSGGRIPSIAELCAVASVSERRLRQAFTSEFGTPPSRFFRMWALAEAHRRLGEPRSSSTVTSVALDLGFDHMGRFAAYYRATYGESPSATLRPDRTRNT